MAVWQGALKKIEDFVFIKNDFKIGTNNYYCKLFFSSADIRVQSLQFNQPILSFKQGSITIHNIIITFDRE